MNRLIKLLIAICILPVCAMAQGGRVTSDPMVISGSGRPIGGALVAVCQPATINSAVANGSLLVLTMASNPVTLGYAPGGTLWISGYTAGDAVFNAGTLANGILTGGLPILAVSPTTITLATSITHSSSSTGLALQMGSSTLSCAGLSTLYTDASLTTPTTNPLVSDGYGNYGAGIAAGVYYSQIYGQSITTTLRQFIAFNNGTFPGTIASPQVAVADGSNHLAGYAGMTYGPSAAVPNALNLIAPATSCTGVIGGGAALAFTNSTFTTTSYIQKCTDGSFNFNNDGQLVPNHGYIGLNCEGGSSNCDMDLRAGAGGASCYWNTVANVGISLPTGSIDCEFPNGGVGTAKNQFHSGSPNFTTWQWESSNGCTFWFVINSTNKAGLCPPASGNPNPANLPTATALAGQQMQSNGANPQILSWVTTGAQCGTISANGACANTLTQAEHCISGIAVLTAGASTITGISPAFTSSSSFTVITNDLTTKANASNGAPASASSITFSGTGTDSLNFVACGG